MRTKIIQKFHSKKNNININNENEILSGTNEITELLVLRHEKGNLGRKGNANLNNK